MLSAPHRCTPPWPPAPPSCCRITQPSLCRILSQPCSLASSSDSKTPANVGVFASLPPYSSRICLQECVDPGKFLFTQPMLQCSNHALHLLRAASAHNRRRDR